MIRVSFGKDAVRVDLRHFLDFALYLLSNLLPRPTLLELVQSIRWLVLFILNGWDLAWSLGSTVPTLNNLHINLSLINAIHIK
jgi:hypothetical protein